jgi:hypothetical protein
MKAKIKMPGTSFYRRGRNIPMAKKAKIEKTAREKRQRKKLTTNK